MRPGLTHASQRKLKEEEVQRRALKSTPEAKLKRALSKWTFYKQARLARALQDPKQHDLIFDLATEDYGDILLEKIEWETALLCIEMLENNDYHVILVVADHNPACITWHTRSRCGYFNMTPTFGRGTWRRHLKLCWFVDEKSFRAKKKALSHLPPSMLLYASPRLPRPKSSDYWLARSIYACCPVY